MGEDLFSDATLKLGRLHWYLLRAATEMHGRRHESGGKTTDFDEEVQVDEIHWWVFKKEDDVGTLKRRTDEALAAAQQIKEDSEKILVAPAKSYDDLLRILRNFADQHNTQIEVLLSYLSWLFARNVLAPSILFCYRIWGSTRMAYRLEPIVKATVDGESPETIKRLAERVLGLRSMGNLLMRDKMDYVIGSEMFEAKNPEDPAPIVVPESEIVLRTSYETRGELRIYFEKIRDALRNIRNDIDLCESQQQLKNSDAFWRRFSLAATKCGKAETTLWDFKKSLEMWHIERTDQGRKDAAEVKFAEAVASFANAKGGVIIIGISDPRKVIGIGQDPAEIERRITYLQKVIAERVRYKNPIIELRQVAVKSESGDVICLVVIIAQAHGAVSVNVGNDKFTYPKRQESGLVRVEPHDLWSEKLSIRADNCDFLAELEQFVRDNI